MVSNRARRKGSGNRGGHFGVGFLRVNGLLMARGELDPDNPADSRDHLIYALSRVSATR